MVSVDGAGETLCACGKPEGVSWYWLKLDLSPIKVREVFLRERSWYWSCHNVYNLLDSVPSPCGEMTSGSQLFARSNIFRIMGTIDREMVFDRLCDRPRVEGPKSVARCSSTSWKWVSLFLPSSSSNLGILESWMAASSSHVLLSSTSSSSGVAGCSLVSGLVVSPWHSSSSASSSANCSWGKVSVRSLTTRRMYVDINCWVEEV